MFFQHTMPNGIRIIAQKLPHFHSVSIGVWVGTGSVKEVDGERGISHFIEHMMFKGTERRSAQDIAFETDSLGAQINAFTSKECTCYYIKATDDMLENCCDILGDIVQNSVLDSAEMEKEKGVVLEEILMVEDSPEDLAHDAICELFYRGHPLSLPILGTKETVSAFAREDLQAYMKKHYVADNMLIAVAGNFDENQLIDCISRHFDHPNAGQALPFPGLPERSKKRIEVREKDIEQVHICLSMPGYGSDDDLYYPLLVLNNALGGNMSSRLFQKIREQQGLAYSVYSYTSSYRDNGALGFYAGTNSKNAVTVVSHMLDEIALVKKDCITQEEMVRSKNQLKGSFVLGSESTGARMTSIGKSMLLLGKVRTEEETLRKIEAVTMDGIRSILDNVLDTNALCAALVGRVGDSEQEISKLW